MSQDGTDKLPYLLSYANKRIATAVAKKLNLSQSDWVYVSLDGEKRKLALSNRHGYRDVPERIVGTWANIELKYILKKYD